MANKRFEEIARMTNRDDESIKREVIISYNKETEKYQIIQDEIKIRNGEATRYHMGPAICLTGPQFIELRNLFVGISFEVIEESGSWLEAENAEVIN